MRLGDVLDDSQSQAGTHRVVLGCFLGAIVLLENIRLGVFTDTNTLINNLYLGCIAGEPEAADAYRTRRV